MSVLLDNFSNHLGSNAGDKTTTSRADLGDRRTGREGTNNKTKTLRLDSPTTIEACQELGILVEDLRPKTIEEFKDPNLEEEIIQLRFNHYFKRYNQNVTDVFAKKRQIYRHKQRQLKLQQQQQLELASGADISQMMSKRPFITNVDFSTPNGRSFSNQNLLPVPMANSLNKTYAYLRTSHETAETKELYDIIGNENSAMMDETIENFDTALAGEINKFNKLKRQKQKEAKDTFESEMRRVKTVEDMKAKEKRREELEKKNVLEKKKMREEKAKKAEEKLEKIREADRRFLEHKEEEKERMQKKLEETKKKLAEESEGRAKYIAEHEHKLEVKRKVAEERRERLKLEEQARCDQLKFELESKMNGSIDRHAWNMNEKTSRIKMQITKIEDNVKRMKEKQRQDNVDFVQNLVEKLVKKEEDTRAYQHQQQVELKKREKEAMEKSKRFFGHQANLKDKQEDRVNEINERFRKVHENLQAKREQEEKAMRIKQEATKLKILDKQQNYLKKQRQVAYERQKILDRQKYNQEKLQWLKSQRDILQQAKVEVSIQAKIERDRIENAIQQLSKLTSETGVSTTINDQQKRLLKEVLKPEDYRAMQEEERRKEEERLEAEEARKNGMPLPPVVKAR